MDWESIPGWFDFQYLYHEQVERAQSGARFVEVGAWLGKSTAFMAERIKRSGKLIEFNVVDTWQGTEPSAENGGGTDGLYSLAASGSIRNKFVQNMVDCGVIDYVNPIESDSVKAAEQFEDESLDFVFIDGDHRSDHVFNDLCAWWPKVKPGGLLAGHDYNEPGPHAGATAFSESIRTTIYGDGVHTPQGYRCYGIPKPAKEDCHIFLGIPSYDGTVVTETVMLATSYQYSGTGSVTVQEHGVSLLASNFNSLWCMALNDPKITHFAMLHADIVPMKYWLDVLLHEMRAEKAQLVSTIIPIKDELGVTSTGIAHPETSWVPLRRFTMSELMVMPPTLDAERAGYPGYNLVANTGCWIADLRDPRWRTENESGELMMHFTVNDRITKVDGAYKPWCEPEDFYFSKQAQELGMRVVVTRKVQANHYGRAAFKNEGPWGTWKADERTRKMWDKAQEQRCPAGS
jgi:SAM-dependent methyltransferase